MRTNLKRLIGLSGLIVLAALLAACWGEPFVPEGYSPTGQPVSPVSPTATPSVAPSPTAPDPARVDDAPTPTVTAAPDDAPLPRETPTAPTEEAPTMETHPTKPPQAQEAVAAARAFLASELDVPVDEIGLLSVEAETWSDTSLGCPQPGHGYAQVITPGYRMLLEARNRRYEVHTDQTGKLVVLCDGPARGGQVLPFSEE